MNFPFTIIDMTQQYQEDYADVNIKISELEQEVKDNYEEFLKGRPKNTLCHSI